MFTSKKVIKPLPFPVYLWTTIIIACFGLGDSIYLAISHYRVYTDIAHKSFCAISRAINCDTVSQSTYAIMLNVPLAVWGIVGYFTFLLGLAFCSTDGAQKQRGWSILVLVSLVFSIHSLILALISNYLIHSYCIMCIALYVVNLALLFFTWLTRSRFETCSIFMGLVKDVKFFIKLRKQVMIVFIPLLVVMITMILSYPRYWELSPPPLRTMPTGMTEDGHPWSGAENPVLEIIEYTDYQCFQCKKMHFFLRTLAAENPGKIKLIHRHFPMDHSVNPLLKKPFHSGAGKMALLAIFATLHNRFWEVNDFFFNLSEKSFKLKEIADISELDVRGLTWALQSPQILYKLQMDLKSGLENKITGTPSYIIHGKVYNSTIPPEIIKQALND